MSSTENSYIGTDLGNIALNPRGEYDDTASYEYLDTVSYKGGSYVCLAELAKTISGIAPAQGKNTDMWQMIASPGDLTSDYIAMHDDVVNDAKQVETSRAAVELSQQEIEAAQADVTQMRKDTQEAAEEAASSRDSAAGYAQSAEASRTAAAESEQNINAQVAGFDTHVAKKTSEAESAIKEARRAAVSAVSTKQDNATQAVTDEGDKQIKKVEDAGTEQVGKAKSAGASAVSAAGAAGVSAVNAVKAQQTASIKAVADEGTQQVTAVNTAGSTQVSTIETKGADQVKAIQEASKNALQNISNGVDKGLSEEGKAADAKATGEAISNLTEDMTSKADKTSLEQTNRKLDALWKLNQGISYKFEEDNTEAYQKAIPTGAKLGSVKSVAGKTIVWNWLSNVIVKMESRSGIDYVSDGKNISLNGSATSYTEFMISGTPLPVPVLKGHKYYISTGLTEGMSGLSIALGSTNMSIDTRTKGIMTCSTGNMELRFLLCVSTGVTLNNTVITPKLVDLTKMFGAGNEPSTVEEFEAMFPNDYYEYNAGELMSVPVEEVISQGRNLVNPDNFTLEACDYKNGIFYAKDGDSRDNFRLKFQQYIGSKYKESSQAFVTPIVGRNTYSFTVLSDVTRVRISNDGKNKEFSIFIPVSPDCEGKKVTLSVNCIDLTVGASKLKDIQLEFGNIATVYAPYRCEAHQIPQEILDLQGYGSSAGDVYNEVDWENKQYIQRIGSVDLSTLTWNYNNENQFFYVSDINVPQDIAYHYNAVIGLLCEKYEYKGDGAVQVLKTADDYTMYSYYDKAYIKPSVRLKNSLYTSTTEFKQSLQGMTLYYELAEPVITDISDLIPEGFLENLEVESSGTLTFKNENGDGYRIPVKSVEEYVVKLSEIAGGTE